MVSVIFMGLWGAPGGGLKVIIWRWQATKGEPFLWGELSPLDTMSYRKKKSRVTQTGCILLWDFGEQKGGGLKVIIWRWQATKGEPSFRGELTPLDTMSYKKKVELHKQGAYFTSAYQFLDF